MTSENISRLKIDKSISVGRKSRFTRYIMILFFVLIVAAIIYLYQKGILSPAVDIQTTSVQYVYPSQTFTLMNASGYIVAQRKAAVASKITGRLVYLAVEEGSRVKSGDIIARLENDDMLAARDQAIANMETARFNLKQAVAEMNDAEKQFDRSRALIDAEYIAHSEFDAAEARYISARALVDARKSVIKSSQAALREADVMLDYTQLRAPFDAVVLTKNADVGDIVTPLGAAANAKAAVVDVADMASLMVEVDVSESSIGQVQKNQPCEIQLDALPDERFPGRVHMIVPTADRSTASVMVKVAFDRLDPRILPEMSAKTAFLSRQVLPEEQKPIKALASTAIVQRDNQQKVFLIAEDRVVETRVETGKRFDNLIELRDGPDIGEKVVLNPGTRIQNGVRIKIIQ
ncbi:MAG TPA: efflux RND transporter periplasmic adaptor subunit [Desulfatirhabdiaceae bacterium]|nr:efflux RND transporter periplasmic adaptor subunit [Desulfatirhabdiaceae bacterium]